LRAPLRPGTEPCFVYILERSDVSCDVGCSRFTSSGNALRSALLVPTQRTGFGSAPGFFIRCSDPRERCMPLLACSCPGTRSTTAGRRRLPLVLRSAEGGVALRQSITPRRIVARAREISRRSCELEEMGRWQEREGPTPGQGEWRRNPPPARNAVKNEIRWGQFGGSPRQRIEI
jgi:hypothetical protein